MGNNIHRRKYDQENKVSFTIGSMQEAKVSIINNSYEKILTKKTVGRDQSALNEARVRDYRSK